MKLTSFDSLFESCLKYSVYQSILIRPFIHRGIGVKTFNDREESCHGNYKHSSFFD